MYESDLKEKMKMVDALVPLEVRAYDRPAEVGVLPRAVVASRIAAGAMIFVASSARTPVAYLCATTKECWIGEIDDRLLVSPGEVYFYDAYTRPEWRGKRIYPRLICAAARYFRQRSFERAMIFATRRNARSIRGIARCGFYRYATVRYCNFMGWKSWTIRVGERHVGSRLRLEN